MNGANYEVIARRYRPKAFDQLLGQEHIVQTLMHAIERQQIAHAYLFTGPRGTGKTTMARLFAMALNCKEGPAVKFSTDDPLFDAIWRGKHLDVMEIDGASNNSVEEIRNLRDQCAYRPVECRFKIFIVDEVHMLTNAAFNALLKILEEPPAHVKFIFATTEAHKIPPTVLSRCQRFQFRSISRETIGGKLLEIAKHDGIILEKGAEEAMGRLAMGSMRDAQSILEQMLTFCGKVIREKDVLDMYAIADEASICEIVHALLRMDMECVIAITQRWTAAHCDLHRALLHIGDELRRQLLIAVEKNESNCAALISLLQTVEDHSRALQFSLTPEVMFPVILLQAIESSRRRPIGDLMEELRR
ncbi:MAG: DNA polymerase III subunit gamma/tau [Puniceicoccales bacterium]|nr:DNA polymerase III subunit gamma/tau [Puniceicoccales bacterium]